MENYYSLLGIDYNSSSQDIKKAFREKAKRLHPDIAGSNAETKMRKLLAAYEVLSNQERRYEYDRIYRNFIQKVSFDYRRFLQEQIDDPKSLAKLIFFDLLHLNEENALEIWKEQGGIGFGLDKLLDRGDYMDCTFLLAEELEKRNYYYEAFILYVSIVKSERKESYFRHFMAEVEGALKEIARIKLKGAVEKKIYIECLEMLLGLGFSKHDEARWMRSMAEVLIQIKDENSAREILQEALKLDPNLPNVVQLKRKLNIKE